MRSIKNKNEKNKNITKKNIEPKPIIRGTIIEEKEGWVVAHIFGEPYDRGFAHGYLLKNELKRVINTFPFIVKEQLDVPLQKFINKSNKIIKPKIKKYFPEFYNELRGICDGANYGAIDISLDFLIAWNSLLSLYDVFSKKTERCSAFIACGNSTENGDIIMGHNTHSDFATGQLLNIVLYVTPTNGNSFVMQTSPGFIASSSDWFICSSGIIGCETTIGDTNYKPKFGTPYFCRIRQAMQYGKSLDDYVKIMMDKNAGDYACSWLLGDIKQNEIMLFELGLKEKHIQTTKNGVFYGMNSAIGENVRKNETNDKDYDNLFTSSGSRNARLNELLNEKYNGSINLDNSKKILHRPERKMRQNKTYIFTYFLIEKYIKIIYIINLEKHMNNEELLNKIKQLEEELEKTKEHLKKYTAPKERMKKYYENHKEELLNKMKKYRPSPDKIKEKNRKAYLKRKEKMKQEKENNENMENII